MRTESPGRRPSSALKPSSVSCTWKLNSVSKLVGVCVDEALDGVVAVVDTWPEIKFLQLLKEY